ncbi:MAG: DUF1501 domain-containing protein [Bryobacteraceae bacterium]|nr:DUF1501 domain-containing protein [Bryobacteraceae bacterium]MDW8379852.1 DUF1501 domain-containing protein [Bryobacterales bacterium]
MKRETCGRHQMHRRHFLLGAASAAGFHLLRAHADAEVVSRQVTPRGTARACIFINLNGGPSHLDTFTPKDGPWNPPDADLQGYPGGIVLSRRFFPKLSQITSDLCILRSLVSWEAAHERGQFYLQTAHPSNPAFAQETPHIGAVICRELGKPNLPLPPFLSFYSGGQQGAAFLGGRVAPLMPTPNRAGLATLEHNYHGSAAASRSRFDQKFALLEALDRPLRQNPFDASMAAYAAFYDSARQMMYNEEIARVFRFSADDEGRYGATAIGRGLILARNAVQAKNGAVFINVTMGGWDTHQQMFDTSYSPNMYTLTNDLDRAVGALVEDLKASGDFRSTLIVMMGEFGRTPGVLNSRGGRDHHKNAMCAALLGGGVKGGQIIGDQSPDGSTIVSPGWKADRAIYTEDVAATIFSALGIDWTKSITDTPSGRRFEYIPYASEGIYMPVNEVFG